MSSGKNMGAVGGTPGAEGYLSRLNMYFYEHVVVSMNTLISLKVPYFKTNQG